MLNLMENLVNVINNVFNGLKLTLPEENWLNCNILSLFNYKSKIHIIIMIKM